PEGSRRTRGVLPLQTADDGKLARAGLADFDPFHVLCAEPGAAVLWSWDGDQLAERELGPGLHVVVNSGLASDVGPGGPGGGAAGGGGGGRRRPAAPPVTMSWPASRTSCRGCARPRSRARGPATRSRGPGATGCR